jgi:hypothetical protein
MTWLATSAQAGIAVTAMAGIGELGMFSSYRRLNRTSNYIFAITDTDIDIHQIAQQLSLAQDSLEDLMLASIPRLLLHPPHPSSSHSEQVKEFSPLIKEVMT